MTCEDLTSATSSPALADGPSLSEALAGLTTALSGLVRALASRSAPPVEGLASATPATSGPSSDASSRSARLQSSLESRLRAALDVTGSPEYALTWKHWAMQSGPPICALRASARRTSDSDCGGWPTPTKGNADGSQMAKDASTTGRRPDGSKATVSLNQVAQAAGWPTPTRQDSASSGSAGYSTESDRHPSTTLTDAARFAGWPTARQTDGRQQVGEDRPGRDERGGEEGRTAGLGLRGALGGLGDTSSTRLEIGIGDGGVRRNAGRAPAGQAAELSGPWSDYVWLPCADGKSRRIEPGLEPLAHGVPARVGRLRGYGNAIVSQVAATFIQAVMEVAA